VSDLDLPLAIHGLPLPDEKVPVVSVSGGKIHLDGAAVDDPSAIVAAGRPQRVDGLWNPLKAAREQWRAAHPGAPFPGVVLFAFDKSAPALVVKSVFQTAAFVGFPNAQFAVRGKDGTVQRLPVDAIVPGPPNAAASARGPAPGARLLVGVRPAKQVLMWRHGAAVVSTTEVTAIRDLTERVRAEWAQHALHRQSRDKAFDEAILYVGDDVDYAGLVAVVDAIAGTTREIEAAAGTRERVPALNVSLSIASDIVGAGDPLSVGRGLPPETIQRIVRQHSNGFRACYEQGFARNASLAGLVRVRFVIRADGKVGEVEDAGESTLPDADVVRCIVRKFGQLSFPPPDGGQVDVVYPIRFAPDGTSPGQ
jgi:hypothetical protein